MKNWTFVPTKPPKCATKIFRTFQKGSDQRFHYSSYAQPQILEMLDSGLDVNKADYDLRTALHIAACEGYAEIVRILLDAGADMLAQDRWGMTPYDEARKGDDRLVRGVFQEEMVARNIPQPKLNKRENQE
jgi:hypothetical protein